MPMNNIDLCKERLDEINQQIAGLNPGGSSVLSLSQVKAEIEALKVTFGELEQNDEINQKSIDEIKGDINQKFQEIQSYGGNVVFIRRIESLAGEIKDKGDDIKRLLRGLQSNVAMRNELAERIKVWQQIKTLIQERTELERQINIDSQMNRDQLRAYQRNPDSSGRSLVLVDLFQNLLSHEFYRTWRDEFCNKNSYQMNDGHQNKIEFVSGNEKLPSITVEKGCVSMSSSESKEDIAAAAQLFVEIYLNCIKGKDVFGHKIESSNEDVLKCLVSTLAVELDKLGDNSNVIINGKKVVDILSAQSEKLEVGADVVACRSMHSP